LLPALRTHLNIDVFGLDDKRFELRELESEPTTVTFSYAELSGGKFIRHSGSLF
jgi:hypothetical protein